MKDFINNFKEVIKFYDDHCFTNYRLCLTISGIIFIIDMLNKIVLKNELLYGISVYSVLFGSIGIGAMLEALLRDRIG